MHSLQAECLNGRKIGILEMTLKSADNQLELSWKITAANAVYRMVFFNISRLRLEEISAPIEIHGFEIIDHSQNGWERDSTFEIRDFEYNRVHFFCECYSMIRE